MTRLILPAFASLTMLLAMASGANTATWLEDGERSAQDASNGNSLGWVNPRTGVVGTFTEAAARSDTSGRECREYSFTAQIAGSQQEIFGVACREPDGSWQEASESFEPQLEARPEAPVPDSYSRRPPEPGYAPYPYAGWARWYSYPGVGLSASYCFGGFCFGSGYSTGRYFGYRYPYYGYPNYYSQFGFRFGHRRQSHYRHHGKRHRKRNHYRKRRRRHH